MPKSAGQKKNTNLVPRPPIVVVMGHIDHGKTKLLDYIRKTNIVEKESGGITQHVGAYEAEVLTKTGDKKKITFIDTPGHEAFAKMRSRGAAVADIAILVVAADEGVKPQTLEALSAIKKADLPFVVALNKMDKENVQLEKVQKELLDSGVQIEEWGGKVPLVPISAKTGQGVDDLLEVMLLVADLEELKGDLNDKASGVVIESQLDPRRGVAATLLIRDGVLRAGDFVRADDCVARVRIFEDYLGRSIKEASFSAPVRVVGFDKLPSVGSIFKAHGPLDDIETASTVSERKSGVAQSSKTETEKTWKLVLNIVVKADVAGSLEAIEHEIMKFSKDDILVNIIRSGVGDIGEDDIKLVSGLPHSLIIGFRVTIDKNIAFLAERLNVSMKFFDIIYRMSEWLKDEIEKSLPQEVKETVLGRLKVLKFFKKGRNRQVVGGVIISGKIAAGKEIRILRRDFLLSSGRIVELQQGKIRTEEVSEGKECGLSVESSVEIAPGDIIETIEKEIVKRSVG